MKRFGVIVTDIDGNCVQHRFDKSKSPWTLDRSVVEAEVSRLSEPAKIIEEEYEPIEVDIGLPDQYREWIMANVLDDADGLCLEWAGLMSQAFPELKLIRGVFETSDSAHQYGHFWCETPDGLIVDPTAQQFGDPCGHYYFSEEAVQDGVCIVCGGPTYMGWEACCVYCWCENGVKQKSTTWEAEVIEENG